MGLSHCDGSGTVSGRQRMHTDHGEHISTQKKLPGGNLTTEVAGSNHCIDMLAVNSPIRYKYF